MIRKGTGNKGEEKGQREREKVNERGMKRSKGVKGEEIVNR